MYAASTESACSFALAFALHCLRHSAAAALLLTEFDVDFVYMHKHFGIRYIPHALQVLRYVEVVCCVMAFVLYFGAREKLEYTVFYFCKIKFSQSLSVFAVGSAF